MQIMFSKKYHINPYSNKVRTIKYSNLSVIDIILNFCPRIPEYNLKYVYKKNHNLQFFRTWTRYRRCLGKTEQKRRENENGKELTVGLILLAAIAF